MLTQCLFHSLRGDAGDSAARRGSSSSGDGDAGDKKGAISEAERKRGEKALEETLFTLQMMARGLLFRLLSSVRRFC